MSTTTKSPPAPAPPRELALSPYAAALASPATAVAVVWLCSAAAAIFSPDMVTGSAHEHMPIVAITIWLWTLSATAYVLLASRAGGSVTMTVSTSAIWLAVVLVSLAAPVMVTGTDPTEIPLGAILAPVVGALATGFIAVQQASRT